MKKHIKLILRTLFSNNACVEAARTKEVKYNVIAVTFAILALFFASLATCVTGFKQQGGAWLRGSVTYSFENGMKAFKDTANEEGVILELTEKHTLEATNWDKDHIGYYNQGHAEEKKPSFENVPCFTFWSPNPEDDKEHKVLEIFYCPDEMDFNIFVEEVAKNINPYTVTAKKAKDRKAQEKLQENWLETAKDPDKKGNPVLQARYTSFIVFGSKNVQGALYAPGVSSVVSSGGGDYQHTKATQNLITTLVDDNYETTLKNCAKFFDQAFVNIRHNNTWRSTGIIIAVDSGVMILMGLLVWILTRGKNNPFRIYSFWDSQKIAFYASLTPGLIALLGFLMSNLAMMLFIIGVGIRVMWLSMRTLRYQAPTQQQ